MGNGDKLIGLYLCYKLYFIMYFIDKYIFSEWKYLIIFNEHATGNTFIIFKKENRIFCYSNYVLAI